MRRSLRSLCFLMLVLISQSFQKTVAQDTHYIYIQSENNQPFYIKLNGSAYGSNSTGYLLIPHLSNGKYDLLLGFPKNTVEYQFAVAIKDDDKGLSLKQAVDNSWSLFDMVNYDVTKGTVAVDKPAGEIKKTVDATKKTDEPKKEIQVPVPPVTAPEITKPVEAPAVPVVQTPSKSTVTTETADVKKTANSTIVHKIFEKVSNDGIDQVYIVQNGNKNDTVILYIPALKEETPVKPAATGKKPEQMKMEALAAESICAIHTRLLTAIKPSLHAEILSGSCI